MIILRVDVDNPYKGRVDAWLGRRGARNIAHRLGYYRNLVRFTEFLEKHDVKATFFLSDVFPPPRALRRHLEPHDVGLHVSTGNEGRIFEAQGSLISMFRRPVSKFSPHTVALSDAHRGEYLSLLESDGFTLFSDNLPLLNLTPKRTRGGVYFPEMVCTRQGDAIPPELRLDMTSLDEVAERGVVVLCTHPVELDGNLEGAENTQENLEAIFRRHEVTSFQEYLKHT